MEIIKRNTIWVFLILLIIVMSIISPNFLTVVNFITVLKNVTAIALLSFGLTFVFLGGGFDLSQGANLLLAATLIVSINPEGGLFFTVVVLFILGVSSSIGLFNGYLIGKQQLNSFIVTLGMRSIIGTFIFIRTSGMVISAALQSRILEYIGLNRLFNFMPVTATIWMVIAAICWFIVRYTTYARRIKAVGSSTTVGRYSGLKIENLQMSTYVINGLLAGIAGILVGCEASHINPVLVWHYDFDAITACAIGGVSLFGGKGTIIDTLSGVLLLGFINNSMILIGVPYTWQLILKGLVLLLAIISDRKK